MRCMSIMRPDRIQSRMRSIIAAGQRGFSIVSAIFLLVVLAALGAFMLTFSPVQHTTSAQDALGSRAYHAARTGVEWGAYQVRRPEIANLVTAGQVPYECPADPTIFNLGGALAGFTVAVQCTMLPVFRDGTNFIRIYTITSTATTTSRVVGNPDYVERQLTLSVPSCRLNTATGANCP
jgi:MSHA biogenesis protein MshP